MSILATNGIARLGVHVALALTLFLVTNWTGRRLYSRGYLPMSIVYRHDRAPVLNTGVRILVPLIFLVLTSAALYTLHLDTWVNDIWLVAVYSVVFRWVFVAAWGRLSLLSWKKEGAYAITIIGGSYWLYSSVIQYRANLLPQATELANEVWFITIIFLFYMMNEIGSAEGHSEARKRQYILSRALRLRDKFSIELKLGIPHVNRKLESLILGVMIYESFNRPFLARVAERIAFHLGAANTLGLMQVTTNEPISDRESVQRGIQRIVECWENHRDELHEWELRRKILMEYNPSDIYDHEVSTIADMIFERMYTDSEDTLSTMEPEDPMAGFRQMVRMAVEDDET